ncbi:hypothetical protein [Thiomicrorhabdus sp.]|uniref:hypothetical protein n=1 Tax=Thiomicrorhabdus sp. TaxID=2039724 RepID=UPI0029C71792|nr:hypothetical protein [Thiomicrorhabdus sp.]
MSSISQVPTVGQFSFSINLPENSFIKRFIAVSFVGVWNLSVETERGQTARVLDQATQRAKKFQSLDDLAYWLANKGVPEMSACRKSKINDLGVFTSIFRYKKALPSKDFTITRIFGYRPLKTKDAAICLLIPEFVA